MRPPSSQWIPTKLTSNPTFSYSAPASVSIPTPTYLGVIFDRTHSFSKHVSSLKAKFFPLLKALRCISASSWGPSKESLSLLYKSFRWSLLTYASPGWFPFLSATNITKFPISGLARLGVKPRLCRSSWRAFASTHPLMLPSTSSREALLACSSFPPWNLPSFTVESTLSTLCSRSDPPLTRQGAALAHLDSLPSHNLVLWTDDSVPFAFGKGDSGVLANCSLCGTETTLSFSAGAVCSSFSAEACVILHTLCWSRQHQQVRHLSSLLLLSDSCFVLAALSSPPSFLSSQTLWQIWQELSSLSSMGPRTLVSTGERRG